MAKQTKAESSVANDGKYLSKVQKIVESWSPEVRGYAILASGLFLLLFSLGYFQFLRVAIGILGLILIFWGAIQSKVIQTATDWFEKIKERF